MATILIVEDDLFIRELTTMTIEAWGYHTLLASDLDEGFAALRAPQHIDLLFTDIYLKAEIHAGCELAHEAIKLWPNIGVLYTTGNTLTGKMKAMFVEGSTCLRKPYTDHQLQTAIENLLAA